MSETEQDIVTTEELAAAEAARKEEERELRQVYGGWAFLVVLFAAFLGLAFVAYGCDDDGGDEGAQTWLVESSEGIHGEGDGVDE